MIYGQKYINCTDSILYFHTVDLICKYSNAKGEFPGIEADSIAKSVYYIVYSSKDPRITIEDKLDLIHLMIYYQKYSSNIYRSIVKRNFSDNDSLIFQNTFSIMPISICYYCDSILIYKLASKISVEDGHFDFDSQYYNHYYLQLFRLISSVAKGGGSKMPTSSFYLLLESYVIQNLKHKSKFNCFK